MAELAEEIPVNIEDELKQSYLDYAMSVIVGRALPDVRDGLKPVHRRILFAMKILGNDWNKPYKKSARVVGDVIGKYHPHGDTAVYDALVRMAQSFSMGKMLIDGQGNFGSVDGDPPAAMRYTEVRMAKIASSFLSDLDKNTVDFVPNYDDTELQPEVLPTRIPNILINGGSGIAVGMATNIPPHNLGEVINATLLRCDDPDCSVESLMEHLPGPDFPTKGIISGRAGIKDAYKTGRGRIIVRAQTEIEQDDNNKKQAIIINELPYQVNKARLIEKIAELVKHKKIEGISALRDESDKDGMRVVIELKRGEVADVVLNNLFSQTQLQVSFGVNMVALVDNQPKLLSLPQVLDCFINHRKEVVSRRTQFELDKARDRCHILEGLGIALANIDEVIAMIKEARSPSEAREKLIATSFELGQVKDMLSKAGDKNCRPADLSIEYGVQQSGNYKLTSTQAQAILDLKLHKLTGLEQEKIINEFQELLEFIAYLLSILNSSEKLLSVVKDELIEIKNEFHEERKTIITGSSHDLSIEDLIMEENMVVTLSNSGYVKSQPLSIYQAQKRGGRGKVATKVKDTDYITKLLIANTHDTLLCFSSLGKVYWLKVHQIPVASRTSKGKPIVNLLPLQSDENISAILPLREFDENLALFMATSFGTVKKVKLTEFKRPRSSGLIAIDLEDGDHLIGVELTSGDGQILLTADTGKSIRFSCSDVRCMGRSAKGVRGIKIPKGSRVISLIVLQNEGAILTATANGYGKRTLVADYPTIGRGGQGVIGMQTSERNGCVIGALQVFPNDELMLISDQGTLVRTRVEEVSLIGRNTQGVTLINLSEGEKLVGIQRIDEIDIEDNIEE